MRSPAVTSDRGPYMGKEVAKGWKDRAFSSETAPSLTSPPLWSSRLKVHRGAHLGLLHDGSVLSPSVLMLSLLLLGLVLNPNVLSHKLVKC